MWFTAANSLASQKVQNLAACDLLGVVDPSLAMYCGPSIWLWFDKEITTSVCVLSGVRLCHLPFGRRPFFSISFRCCSSSSAPYLSQYVLQTQRQSWNDA